PGALVKRVKALRDDPASLAAVAREVAAMPPHRTVREMVEDYHALLPLAPRPVARLEVGVGAHTALTEPYRQLSEAYAELEAAYARMSEAYEKSHGAYEHVRAEYEKVKTLLQRLRSVAEQLNALQVGKHWWRAPEAGRLL